VSIVLPINMSFQDWAATLFVDFSTDSIPIPPDEEDWQLWAQYMIERDVFQNDSIPLPYGFSGWREWAERVAAVVNG